MEQTINLYQAVRKESKRLEIPLFAEEKAWLGKGYYFWEHHIENAHYWGETHYGGNYEVYESQYCNNKFGLDFVDCYEHREDLFSIYDEVKGLKGYEREYDLPALVRLLYEQVLQQGEDIHYIRIDTGTFYPKRGRNLSVPTRPKQIWIPCARLVQVCILAYPCPEIRCERYERVYPHPPIG